MMGVTMMSLMRATLLVCLYVPMVASAANCGDLSSQYQMNQCAFSEYQKADKKLNDIYRSYRARLDEAQKRQLRDVQRAWVKFRDLSCAFESSAVKGGSVYPLIYQSCLERLTNVRVQALSILANCEEGDLSCPAGK